MKRYLKIKIITDRKSELLVKLDRLNIYMVNIVYQNDGLMMDILRDDLKRIKKYLISYKVIVIEEKGIDKIKNNLKKNSLVIVGLIFGLVLFLVINRLTLKVNVIHESTEMRELILSDLEKYGVVPLSFKKSYQEYEEIIEKIKEDHKDKIEWLEIDVKGMNVNVRVEERIINDYPVKTGFCHIVADKSGIVSKIYTKKGVAMVTINDFVNKGDILISGEIKLNEEVKNNVCASGEVRAEVWYKVKSTYPLKYKEEEKTGKMRYNLMIKDGIKEQVLLKSRVRNKQVQNKLLFKLGSFQVFLQKEYEIKEEDKIYKEEEALELAMEKIREKFRNNGVKFKKIINEKVLQKTINNDNLDIEVFVVVEEDIGVSQNYVREADSDTSDSKNNGDNRSSS